MRSSWVRLRPSPVTGVLGGGEDTRGGRPGGGRGRMRRLEQPLPPEPSRAPAHAGLGLPASRARREGISFLEAPSSRWLITGSPGQRSQGPASWRHPTLSSHTHPTSLSWRHLALRQAWPPLLASLPGLSQPWCPGHRRPPSFQELGPRAACSALETVLQIIWGLLGLLQVLPGF